jgi:diguanylate cyclase (GGDEF)-like protein
MLIQQVCPNFKTCPFVGYLRRSEVWEMITYLFCKSDFSACKRYIRKKLEGKVPPDLWPIESVSVSEILKGLNFDFQEILKKYQPYFAEFEESDEYWELFENGIVLRFKEKFKSQLESFLVFFSRYYEELFLGEFNQSFFIEMAYLYEEKKIDDSIFDSVFLVFISTLEENFIKWLQKKQMDPEKRALVIFTFGRINTLAIMLLKKTIKLIQEIKHLYTSKKQISEIKEELYIDPLTSAYNRKFLNMFEEQLKIKYSYLLLIDLDYFKKINDTYGHQAGDRVLKELVKLLKNSLRQQDLILRYGGEEFLVFLNNETLDKAVIVAEKLRKLVERHTFWYEDRPIKVTISVGVAPLFQDKPFEESFKKADEALYRAKERGRNRVEIYRAEERASTK